MMIERQVCNLELSKRIEELGVKQESYFYWCKIIGTDKWEINKFSEDGEDQIKSWLTDEIALSAFTVSELGEILPIGIECYKREKDDYVVTYSISNYNYKQINDKNEADARAKMLIYLIENGLINKEINDGQSSE